MKKYLTISEASVILGVSVITMRRWDRESKLKPHHRTFGNHRRYSLSEILFVLSPTEAEKRINVCYSRVSSHDQKEDLVRQSQILQQHTNSLGLDALEIKDLGFGFTYHILIHQAYRPSYVKRNTWHRYRS